jgi:hypothetical protein
MIDGFEFAVWSGCWVGFVVESAVGERAAEASVADLKISNMFG